MGDLPANHVSLWGGCSRSLVDFSAFIDSHDAARTMDQLWVQRRLDIYMGIPTNRNLGAYDIRLILIQYEFAKKEQSEFKSFCAFHLSWWISLSNDPKIFWYTIFLHKTCIGYPYFPWNPNWSAFHRHDPWPARCPGPLAEWQATAAKLSGLSGFGLKWWVQWILDLILILILHGGDVGWFLTLHSDYWGDGHLRRRKAGDWVLDPSHGVLSHSRPFFVVIFPYIALKWLWIHSGSTDVARGKFWSRLLDFGWLAAASCPLVKDTFLLIHTHDPSCWSRYHLLFCLQMSHCQPTFVAR